MHQKTDWNVNERERAVVLWSKSDEDTDMCVFNRGDDVFRFKWRTSEPGSTGKMDSKESEHVTHGRLLEKKLVQASHDEMDGQLARFRDDLIRRLAMDIQHSNLLLAPVREFGRQQQEWIQQQRAQAQHDRCMGVASSNLTWDELLSRFFTTQILQQGLTVHKSHMRSLDYRCIDLDADFEFELHRFPSPPFRPKGYNGFLWSLTSNPSCRR